MGAAGLTSSSVEMADKGGIGVEMDLDKVPQREEGMTAYEIMLSVITSYSIHYTKLYESAEVIEETPPASNRWRFLFCV